MRKVWALVCLLVCLAAATATPAHAETATPANALIPIGVMYLHDPEVTCQTHTGENGMVDAFSASTNLDPIVCNVACRAYMQRTGWQDWTYDGKQAGQAGGERRVEAIQMRLQGLLAKDYRLWYRARIDGDEWSGWASDGDSAGTMGMSLPITDIQVRVQRPWEKQPEGNGKPLVDNSFYSEIGHIRNQRKIVPLNKFTPSDKALKDLDAAIKGILDQKYDVGFVMMDLATHQGVAYNCGTVFYGASSIKAPYIAAAIEQHPEAIKKYEKQIKDTLVYSWDHTYKEVVAAYGVEPIFKWHKELRLESDFLSFVKERPWAGYTARDFAKMWVRIYQWSLSSPNGEKFCSWSENPEYSTIHYVLGDRYRTQSKGGWIENDYPYWNVTNDGGIVYAENGTYVLAIMSSVPANFYELHNLTRALDAVHDEIGQS
ncbi:MAG: serine hydrolase [Coriobacteriales bacterium]|nr:serine hydrolase [Coriobacteriales bacterium]